MFILVVGQIQKARLLRDIVEKSYGSHVEYYVSRMSRFSSDVIHEPEREGDIENLMFSLNEKTDEFSAFLEDRKWAMLYEELPE